MPSTSGHDVLVAHAPNAAMALDAMVAAAWRAMVDAELVDLFERVTHVVAEVHGLTPLPRPAAVARPTTDDRAGRLHAPAADTVVAVAEQFAVDVSAIDDGARHALGAALGARTGDVVQAVWVADMVPRARAALDALHGPSSWPDPSIAPPGDELWGAIDGFIRVVPALEALDPVLTELVRLRGARQHQCRLCQSLRSRPALLAGATDADFDAVDDHATSALPAPVRAALALTDALIWLPGRIPTDVTADVRRHLDDAQGVELVLDIVRNAANKIAVAFAADAPHVDDGVEIYEVDAAGETHYGLTLDAPT